MKLAARTRHRHRELEGLRVHYREAGVPSPTAVHDAGHFLLGTRATEVAGLRVAFAGDVFERAGVAA
ncbi:hypothetical protein [Streptomyces sp. 184]|uniref:hypothetical protein n=1 Tax=Streptomyces sp. 184 TaxID=1827526 RepID=UPI00389182A4